MGPAGGNGLGRYLRYVGFCWPVLYPALWRELTANDVHHLVGKLERPRFRLMVRFLRRRICSQGRALTFVGVAETFVALNRGPRVEAMDIWSR
jgi:hypothetical protein